MVYYKAGSSQGIRPNLNLNKLISSKPINISAYKTLQLSYASAINKISNIQIKDEPWEEWNTVYKMIYEYAVDT